MPSIRPLLLAAGVVMELSINRSQAQQPASPEQQQREVVQPFHPHTTAWTIRSNGHEPRNSSNDGSTVSSHRTSTPQQVGARLRAKQHKHTQLQQRQLSTLPQLLSAFQQVQLQQQLSTSDGQAAAAEGTRLDRKLTAILTDSCSSWQDVALVLFVADSTGRLNALHIAAALATLAHIEAAERVVNSGSSDGSSSADGVATRIVPISRQQAQQLKFVRQAAATAVSMGFCSRWNLGLTRQGMEGAVTATSSGSGVAGHIIAGRSAGAGPMEEVDDWDQQQQLLDQLCSAVAEFWLSMSHTTLVSCCWSLARLGQVLPQPLLPLVGQALLDMTQQLNNSNSSQDSRTDDTTSTDESDASAVLARQVVVMCWSLAKMSVEPQDLQQQHDQQQQQLLSQKGTDLVGQVLTALTPHLPALTCQSQVMLWWTLATWHYTPAPVEAAALLQVTAAAMAQQALLPRGLSVSMWAVARLQLCPDASWLAAWLAAMRAALPATNSHDVAVSVWALARLGVPPPGEWLAALCWRAAAVAKQMAPQELPVLLWGLARLRFRPSLQVIQQLLQRGLVLAHTGQLSPQGLALTLWATASLGVQPRAAWIDAVLASVAEYLPLFRALECSGLMVALVKLKHIPHQSWMDMWWHATGDKLPAADNQQLVQLLWCAVQLGQAPPPVWFAAWQQCTMQAMVVGNITSQGYGLMWHALKQLEVAPGSDWLAAYWQASIQPAVLRDLDCLTAERTLAGLAALNQLGYSSSRPPAEWWTAFLPATQQQLTHAKLVNLCVMLQAAGQLQILLPQAWLNTAMDRLGALLQAEGVICTTALDNISSRFCGLKAVYGRAPAANGRVSYSIAARLRRRWLAVWLKQALEGLRAQEMLARAAAAAAQHRRLEQRVGPAPVMAASSRQHVVLDVLAVWPWLSDAVLVTWPNRLSALQALQGLSGLAQAGTAE
eukprot:GHUV01019966.1.p1 GENE.GHUV01019966.1~~GHUV01019966.1.p1  ORF type:complete len:945 (+),score=374.67 GHUV01019966.1:121-2955(+)